MTSRRAAPGAAPGTLRIDPEAPQPFVRVLAYGTDGFVEQQIDDLGTLPALRDSWPVLWVNVDGLGSEAKLRQLAGQFGLHRLALEDVVSSGQRPKVEPYEQSLFLVARMPHAGPLHGTEQLSLFVGEGFVLSFQERRGDFFDPVRERIRHGRGLIRAGGADYLVYALLDAVVDAYFPLVEAIGEEIEQLEVEVLESAKADAVERIHAVKRRLLALRRTIGPHREALNSLIRDSGELIRPETAVYLRDCYDHLLRLTERVEIYREQTADLMATHLSVVSNRMNEVMRVLTVIASIFIPLTFLAGIYGMNFNPEASPMNMPELNWRWGYPAFWVAIVALGGGLVIFFRRRGWL